jgi:hypothetical protein
VPSGKYNVAISATGFKTASENGVEVLLNQTVKVDVVLQIGQTTAQACHSSWAQTAGKESSSDPGLK